MQFTPTNIEGVTVIEPRVFGDDRGFFMESWNAELFRGAGWTWPSSRTITAGRRAGYCAGCTISSPGRKGSWCG